MSGAPEGSIARPYRQALFNRITEVHWSGRIGILELTAPEGINPSFSHPENSRIFPASWTRSILEDDVTEVIFSGSTSVGNLYDETEFTWMIDSVVFPDSPFESEAEYQAYKNGYVLPDARFEEVGDLRTLGTDVFPASTITGWPFDGSWATWEYDPYPDGRPGYLPPLGESVWGLGEQRQTANYKRDAVRSAWVLDFSASRIGNETVIVTSGGGLDDRLPSYSMAVTLRMFASGATFSISGLSITADRAPQLTQSLSIPYEQAGQLFSITRNGFAA